MDLNTVYGIIRHIGAAVGITFGVLSAYYPDQKWLTVTITVLIALGWYAVPAQNQLLPKVKIPAQPLPPGTYGGGANVKITGGTGQ